ncbi:rod-binding protein [Sphingomicrobium astaxanthinifaciens]|uniref:rod-binding protein n=1 Tax=Sphingomicrobium astaxanthinifaciens TaxID=1227949 RepID=UPI001FCCAC15|nr:rod-binding protein [Sphingomicrobium astaxanthinifaciens]MCJ7420375.1 rod-binding protein [Sphingomicrobium astaxanthinifaciens]
MVPVSFRAPEGVSIKRSFDEAGTTPLRDLKAASQQFEAIFLRQLLATARANSIDDGGLFEGEGLQTFTEMRDKVFADLASQSGQIGLAKRLETHLSAQRPKE